MIIGYNYFIAKIFQFKELESTSMRLILQAYSLTLIPPIQWGHWMCEVVNYDITILI